MTDPLPARRPAGRPDPFVALAGAGNFRDAGGLPAGDGRRVRRGLLYRSNRLSGLDDADRARLAPLGIARIYDLREALERGHSPTRWPGPAIRGWTDLDGARPWSERLGDYSPTPAGMRSFMTDLYATLPDLFAPRIAEIVAGLAAGEGACVIHCSAGKDRTGVVTAILLALAGAQREAILAEYMLTAGRLGLAADQRRAFEAEGRNTPLTRLPADALDILFSVDPAFLAGVFAAIERDHGSLANYAANALGLSAAMLDAYRAAVTEPAGSDAEAI